MPRFEYFANQLEILASLQALYVQEPFCWAAKLWKDDTTLTGTENPVSLEQHVLTMYRLSLGPGQAEPAKDAASYPLQHGLIYGLMPRQFDYLAKGGFYLDKSRFIGDYERTLHFYKALIRELRQSFVRIPYDAGVGRTFTRNDVYFSPWAEAYLKDGGALETG